MHVFLKIVGVAQAFTGVLKAKIHGSVDRTTVGPVVSNFPVLLMGVRQRKKRHR